MTLGENGILRYGHFCGFLEDGMVNLGPIDFQMGLPLKFKINSNDGQNKFELEVHIQPKKAKMPLLPQI